MQDWRPGRAAPIEPGLDLHTTASGCRGRDQLELGDRRVLLLPGQAD
jgi:hypothetical protein